jgi:hypothetical protein
MEKGIAFIDDIYRASGSQGFRELASMLINRASYRGLRDQDLLTSTAPLSMKDSYTDNPGEQPTLCSSCEKIHAAGLVKLIDSEFGQFPS